MYETVTAATAVQRITAWHQEGGGRVVELMGSTGAARADVRTQVRDAVPGVVCVDAAALDGDALVARIREGVWQAAEAGAGVGVRLVVLTEGQRVTGRREWGCPTAVLEQLEREVAEALGVLLVLEVDWHEVRGGTRAQLELESPVRGPDPGRSAAESRQWALQALALQEGGGAPLEVWRQLSWALNHDELELPVDVDEEIEVDRRGWYRFRNFKRSRELARSVDPGLARQVHAQMARWLVEHVGADSDLGRYADAALVEQVGRWP
ncbi:hypothetical protein ACFV9W_31960 [Streptomyces sp. NPDC059897]|uniref:hypothetical protein n=1 Tax=Streptomyces sp. NPDC059897 TaxID=3346994 RepID=UPI00365F84BA